MPNIEDHVQTRRVLVQFAISSLSEKDHKRHCKGTSVELPTYLAGFPDFPKYNWREQLPGTNLTLPQSNNLCSFTLRRKDADSPSPISCLVVRLLELEKK